MARAQQSLEDYAGALESICKVEKYINEESDKDFLRRYYSLRGEISLVNGNISNSVDNYNQSINYALNQEEKVKLFNKALNALTHLSISTENLAANNFEYQKLFANVQPYTQFNGFESIIQGERRIRIGYLSPYFKKSEYFSFIYGILACQNRERFEVTCYSLNSADDPFTKAIEPAVEHFKRVNDLTTKQLEAKIREDQIDILVDLAGHNAETALPVFAYRPAPVQISGIGATATSGLDTISYFITDKQTDPPGQHDRFFKETFIYMPCQFCYASNSEAPQPVPAPAIEKGYVTFGAFHNYNKIGDDMLAVWREILNRVPNSRLIIRADEFNSDSLVDSAYNRMKNLGFNMDTVSFRSVTMDYLSDYLEIDIMLDTFPRSDAMTTFDALFMGVPVVSFYDERRDSRYALTILQNVGLGDFAVNNGNAYMDRAIGLANDKEALNILHRDLRSMIQNNNLQPRHYTNILEQCYEHIINQFQAN